MINGKTALYGVVGDPISHTKSPELHNAWFAAHQINAVYLPFRSSTISEFIAAARAIELRGFNVTVPHKESILDHLDSLDTSAAALRAVNTVKNESGKLVGYNTDYIGFSKLLAAAPSASSALVLGAGGASRCACAVLRDLSVQTAIFNRTSVKANSLAKEFGARAVSAEELTMLSVDVVINATSLGLNPRDSAPIDLKLLSQLPLAAIDLIYGKETAFLQQAKELNISAIDGKIMLVEQAKKSFEVWTGIAPK